MASTDSPEISVIIPVLNESSGINSQLSHLSLIAQDARFDVLVVDGDPLGSTVDAIRDDRVQKHISAPGRARQMNRGAAAASGTILLFLHADTILPLKAFSLIDAALKDSRVVAGAFDLGIDSPRMLFRITERYVALRTRLTRVPFGDQAIFVRRDYFERIGGFKDIPIMEDVELMRRIKKQGNSIVIIPHKVLTSPRRWEKEGILYSTFRNWMMQVLYLFGVAPERIAKFYRS